MSALEKVTSESNGYVNIRKSEKSPDIVIAFSSDTERGKFNYFRQLSSVDASIVFLNCPQDRYYHLGIPGLGDLNSTIDELCKVVGELDPSGEGDVVTFGCSMGGYGALLYGSFIKRARVVAFSPSCPLYTVRPVIAKNRDFHSEIYLKLRDEIFNSIGRKHLFYGGFHKYDLASYFEFNACDDTSSVLLNNVSHQSISAMLSRYSIAQLIYSAEGLLQEVNEGIKYSSKHSIRKLVCGDLSAQDLDQLYADNLHVLSVDSIFCLHLAIAFQKQGVFDERFDSLFLTVLNDDSLKNILKLNFLISNQERFAVDEMVGFCGEMFRHALSPLYTSTQERNEIESSLVTYLSSGDVERKLSMFIAQVQDIEQHRSLVDKVRLIFEFSSINFKSVQYSADALRELALCYKNVGQISLAIDLLETALIIRPKGTLIQARLKDYKKLESNK